jgi:peptidoglycan/xylan/chitin deacetylase (PgdA/CDA1 family)
MLSIATPVSARGPAEARLSDTDIMVDGARMPFRAYSINGRIYVDLFKFALALSGTENQFALRWTRGRESIRLTRGRTDTAISVISTRRIADVERATPSRISIMLDGDEFFISAYSIANTAYFDLFGIAGLLDFRITWDLTENIVDIDTSQPHEDGIVGRVIDPSSPMVALTFDDGPSRFTSPILDVLEEYGAVATFYVVGNRVERYSDVVLRAFNMGNEIANHTWSHSLLPRSSESGIHRQLLLANEAIEAVTGTPPSSMRPPFGSYSGRVRTVAAQLGLPIIRWSLDPSDWSTMSASTTYNLIMSKVKDRDIILLHDTSNPTAEAARRVIPELLNRGFQLVTVSELMYYSGITPEPGKVYRSGAPS